MTESGIAPEHIQETYELPDENQILVKRKDNLWRKHHKNYVPIPKDVLALAKKDYLSGGHNSKTLADKYGHQRRGFLYRMSTDWKDEFEATGHKKIPEPPIVSKKVDYKIWQQVELDYIRGATKNELVERYNLFPLTLERMIKREGWGDKRAEMILSAKQKIEKNMILKGTELETRMTKFMDSASQQLQKHLDNLEKYQGEGEKPLPLEEMATVVKSFATLVDTYKKLYKTEGAEGGSTKPAMTQNLIRVNVMDGAKLQLSAHDPAPILKVT